MMRSAVLLALVASTYGQANSVNKIVSLLEGMISTVQKEGKTAGKNWDEHSEWYRSEKQATEYAITDATDALAAAQACAAESAAAVQKADADIADLAAKLAQSADELEKAAALRESEHADFQKSQQELVDTVDTLVRAANIIRRSTGGSGSTGSAAKLKKAFAQVAATLDAVISATSISTADRRRLDSLLQNGQSTSEEDYVEPTAAAYSEHSTGIVDLLVELKQKAEAELADLRKEESNKAHAYNMLKQSLTDAVKVAETDKARATNDKATSEEQNAKCTGTAQEQDAINNESKSYLSKLTATYAADTQEYDTRTADRADELKALNKAVEILSGASDAFDRRGVFVQEQPDARAELAALLRGAAKRLSSVELSQIATAAMQDPFGKVKGLIGDMIERLQKEAAEEADQKAWCDSEKKKNEAKRDDRASKLENYSSRLESSKADDAQLSQDIAKLSSEISESDASLKAATAVRAEEADAFAAFMEDSRTGLAAIAQAVSVLKNYYGSSSAQGKKDSGNNVISFLEVAQSDMIKAKTEAEETEAAAIKEFTAMKNESEQIRASKAASVKGKESERARLGAAIADLSGDVDGTSTELDATLGYLEKLKGTCVHKVESFESRAAKMQQEIAALEEALDILETETAGASFLQRRRA